MRFLPETFDDKIYYSYNTNKTIIKYETDIKNFSDVYVVSDDSITRYIRQRIESL